MSPLSDTRHKAMLRVGGTTILERLIAGLQMAGVDVVTVVTGYRSAEVREYLRQQCPGPTYQFVKNERYAQTNNVVSLLLALESVEHDDDVLLAECDLLVAPGVLQRLAGDARGNIALLDRYRTGMDGTVVTVRDGLVTRVLPPEAQTAEFEYRGTFKTLNIYRFSSAFCADVLTPGLRRHVEEGNQNCYYETVLAQLGDLSQHHIAAEILDGEAWAEVDDPNDLASASFVFEPEGRGAVLDRTRGGQWSFAITDFAFMKNAYFPPEAMLAAMRHSLGTLVGSYGSTQTVLNEKLGWFLGCAPARVVALNGAAQAFPILRRLWAGQRVALPSPTFGEFSAAFPDAALYRDEPGINLKDIDALAGEVGVVVVVNPNNPTGTTLDSGELHRLAARHPATRFLLDESFIDFSDTGSVRAQLEVEPLTNVAVLSSLSKALGVPGLRIGYLYSHDAELLAAVSGEIPIWNMGSIAEYCIELLLKFRPELEASLAQTKRDREAFRAELATVPIVAGVTPSGGNFLLVALHGSRDTASQVRNALLSDEAIEVKDVTWKFDDGQPRLRLAVRRPEENHRMAQALTALGPLHMRTTE